MYHIAYDIYQASYHAHDTHDAPMAHAWHTHDTHTHTHARMFMFTHAWRARVFLHSCSSAHDAHANTHDA